MKNNPNLLVVTKNTSQEALYALLTAKGHAPRGNTRKDFRKARAARL